MIYLENYKSIIYHIQNNLGLLKKIQNNKWYQSFCPFCNDKYRKINPNHGHLYISKINSYYKCFRCDAFGKLSHLLQYTNFKDNQTLQQILNQETKNSFTYGVYIQNKHYNKKNNFKCLLSVYQQFKKKHKQKFEFFLNYIYQRCLDINPIEYLLFPEILNNNLVCGFMNYNNIIIGYRFLKNNKLRYLKTKNSDFYFFQNINEIYNSENIIICEGAFDLINLHNFYKQFNKSFYVAVNGKYFNKLIQYLLSNYLLIGKYFFHIIYDNDKNFNYKQTSFFLKQIVNKLNPNCKLFFYKPSHSKDVSETMLLTQI